MTGTTVKKGSQTVTTCLRFQISRLKEKVVLDYLDSATFHNGQDDVVAPSHLKQRPLDCGGSTPLSFFADPGQTKERKRCRATAVQRKSLLLFRPTEKKNLRRTNFPILKSGAVQLLAA